MNFASWMSGVYVSYSMASVMGDKNIYPENPLPLFENEEDIKERKEKRGFRKRLCMGCYSKGAVGYKQNSTNGRVCQSGRDDNGNIES